jgi:ComF family protein
MLRTLLIPLAPPLCWGCGSWAGRVEPLCSACRGRLRWLGEEPAELAGLLVWAPLAYAGPARALVRGLKYRGAPALAEAMAAPLAARAPLGLLEPPRALVPVPLDPARFCGRGFNQAERLAAALAERTGLPLSDCLARAPGRGRQVGRSRADRLRALDGAVALRPGAPAPTAALLVDDVVTTGATLAACAAALRRAGCAGVAALAYARTTGR